MTVERLSLHSERYSSTGNIGENFRRLLGAPSLNPLQTVIREAVQNIADAALPSTGPEIHIRIRQLPPKQRAWLNSNVLRRLPKERQSKKLLAAMKSRNTLTVMEICDFHTVGLRGPTRSDRIPSGETKTDFIDFLRNIGTKRDTKQGGGTYGFGKVALYRASQCSTILVDSLPYGTGNGGRRLIGCHLGASFEISNSDFSTRFTGRHWWGIPNPEDGIVEPVTGKAAQVHSERLGFPKRNRQRSGTSIMILDFDANGEDLISVGKQVVEGLLWNFWPRLMRDTPSHQHFKCLVEVEGARLSVPQPEEFPPLDLFSKAMRALRSGEGNDLQQIFCRKPVKLLGNLAIERGLRTTRKPIVSTDSLFPDPSHHIALMRPIELVVKYMEGTPFPDERLEWAGVFVSSHEEEVEQAFADAEPPAHDDWIPANFSRGRAKTYVNVALQRLRERGAEVAASETDQPSTSREGSPLAQLGGQLGAVLDGAGGTGAGRSRSTGHGGGSRTRRVSASAPLFERLEINNGRRMAVFSTIVSQDPGRTGKTLIARANVAVEGGLRTNFDDTDIPQPRVVAIHSADGKLAESGHQLQLAGKDGTFVINVLIPDDYAVTLQAQVLSED